MSQRSAFTSEYIYDTPDYEILRNRAERWGNSKYLCFAPEASWGQNIMPILQGKVGSGGAGMEYEEICDFLRGVKTKYPVTFVILPEGHDMGQSIQRILKTPEGICHLLDADEYELPEGMSAEICGVIFDDYGNSPNHSDLSSLPAWCWGTHILK